MSRLGALLLISVASPALQAHQGQPLQPHDLWSAWPLDPGTVIPLLFAAILYARGARRSRGATRRQTICFWIGWIFLAAALVSPLHSLGEALFSAHMVQHEILMLAAAPMLVLSRPLAALVWGLPFSWRRTAGKWAKAGLIRSIWRCLTNQVFAWCLHAAALWIWHAPSLFQSTLSSEWAHAAQHASFLFTALLFWWSLFYARGRSGYGAATLYLFTTAVHTSILGSLLTFANSIWYPIYALRSSTWRVNPLDDQRLGGLIMWIPAGFVYVAAMLATFSAWMRESEAMAARSPYAD